MRRARLSEGKMAATGWKTVLLMVGAAPWALGACATPQRLPAVPASEMSRTGEALGPIRFLVSRESNSFSAEARNALVKEQQWLASQGKGPNLPPAYFLCISGGGDNGAYAAG